MSAVGEVVRVRTPRRAFLLYVVPLVLSTVQLTVLVWVPHPGIEWWSGPWQRGSWAVMFVLSAALVADVVLRPGGIDLRDEVAVVVGPLRSREIPWRDVQAVAFRRGIDVTLYLAGGREVRCLYPRHNLLFVSWQRVTADYHRVGQWWLAHRGPDWRPIPSPPAPPPPAAAYAPYPPMRPVR
jgi:hypothetical protein